MSDDMRTQISQSRGDQARWIGSPIGPFQHRFPLGYRQRESCKEPCQDRMRIEAALLGMGLRECDILLMHP